MRVKDESKRIAIIENTLEIVYHQGFSGVKMATLAKKTNISVSTLYVYYKNKEDLIVSIASEIFDRESKRSVESSKDDLPFKLKLKSFWLHWINFSVNNKYEMNFIMLVKQSPYYNLIPKAVIASKRRIGADLLELGKKEGLIKNETNEILEAVIGAMLLKTTDLIFEKKLTLNSQDTNMMFGFVWDAIKA